jgi:integrase
VPRYGTRRLDEIQNGDVQKLKAELADLSPKTVNNVLSVLNTLLKAAVSWGVLERLPAEIKLLKVAAKELAFYEAGDYARLVAAAEALDPRIHVLVLLGGDAGLRCGEILALEWTDIDFQRGTLTVQRSEWRGHVTLPKGGKSRRIPMTDLLATALAKYRHLRCARVLHPDEGAEMKRTVLRWWMTKAQRQAGLEETGLLHILRHTFCSRLAMKGAPAKAIQELAGHVNLTTTQRYMHLSPAAKDAAIQLLNEGTGTQKSGDMLETGARQNGGTNE